jgi:hypothetical protein
VVGDRQLVVVDLGSVAVAEDQHEDVAAVDVGNTALAHGLATGGVAVHGLVSAGDEPFHDGVALGLEVQHRGET